MADKKTNYDEIQDEYLDSLIRLAYKNAEALEAQRLMEEDDSASDPVPPDDKEAVFQMFLGKMERLEGRERPKARFIPWKKVLPRLVNIAACIVVLLGIAAPFAVAYVEPIRIKVMQLLIEIKDDHTELLFIEDTDAEFYVPEGYTGRYYPTYIPEGFELTDVSVLFYDTTYQNKAGAKIYYSECTEDDEIDINTEGAILSHATVNGADAFVAEQETYVIITWALEDRYFVIIADTSLDEALKMARSVRRISYSD